MNSRGRGRFQHWRGTGGNVRGRGGYMKNNYHREDSYLPPFPPPGLIDRRFMPAALRRGAMRPPYQSPMMAAPPPMALGLPPKRKYKDMDAVIEEVLPLSYSAAAATMSDLVPNTNLNSLNTVDSCLEFKREVDGKTVYMCEPCQKTFTQEQHFIQHTASHSRCHYEGCTFAAIQKVVNKHYKEHLIGTIPAPASTAADDKWLIERKRNFPSSKNQELKSAEIQSKVARGEILSNSIVHGKFNVDESDFASELRRFQQLKAVIDQPSTSNAANVISSRNSDPINLENGNFTAPDFSHIYVNEPSRTKHDGHRVEPVQQASPHENTRSRYNPVKILDAKTSLMERLLQNEIRHERNVLLQVIRYIVQRRYFLPDSQLTIEERRSLDANKMALDALKRQRRTNSDSLDDPSKKAEALFSEIEEEYNI